MLDKKSDIWRCTFFMTKFSETTKERSIELIESNRHSIASASKELGIGVSIGARWWKLYSIHGFEGLLMKLRTYSGEFKTNAVEYMHSNKLSGEEASARLGIPSTSTLLKWERIYYEEGVEGLLYERRGRPNKNMTKKPKNPTKKIEKQVEEDLIEEVQRLRAENAYLKKYNALVQEKQDLLAKKKQK